MSDKEEETNHKQGWEIRRQIINKCVRSEVSKRGIDIAFINESRMIDRSTDKYIA